MNDPHAAQRERMIRDHIAARGVKDERVLAALRKVPRHQFVKDHLRTQAYGDHALPIGSGSGYQTAVLALLARRVYSLERVPELAQQAIPRMRQLGLDNVKIQVF